MKFTLEIELGNDAMQTADDVRQTLLYVADNHGTLAALTTLDEGDSAVIRDANGNTVGKWEVIST